MWKGLTAIAALYIMVACVTASTIDKRTEMYFHLAEDALALID